MATNVDYKGALGRDDSIFQLPLAIALVNHHTVDGLLLLAPGPVLETASEFPLVSPTAKVSETDVFSVVAAADMLRGLSVPFSSSLRVVRYDRTDSEATARICTKHEKNNIRVDIHMMRLNLSASTPCGKRRRRWR